MHVLRDYQVEAVSAIERALNSGLVNSALLTLPTGTGKTVVLSELAKNNVASRTLIVCPMRELIHQAAEKVQQITGVFPDIEMASLWSSEIGRRNPYIVASKQTLTMKQRDGSKRYQRLTDIGLLVLDEAHTVITGPTIEMIDWYRDRGAMVVGVTATPNRHDKKSLKNAFDVCPYSMTLPEAISLGWLVSPRSNVVRVKSMDLSHVKVQGGDFSATGLNAVVEEERVELEMADVIARESVGLKTAVYCSSVAQAEKLAEILSVRYGLRADFVCADEQKCSSEHRKEVLDSFKSEEPGAIQVVTNCGVLTTGWDFPGLEHIVMARPTKSLSLYTQILGRATRPLAGTVDFPGSTPELRRAAIADSRKPHFKMTDLVDISLSHRICTTIDALEGEMDEKLRDRFMEEVTDGGLVDVQQKMEELRRRMEDEERAEKAREAERVKRQQMLLEARRRQGIRANVQYDTVAVDVMNTPGIRQKSMVKRGPVALFGKYKGQPLAAIDSGYLKWKLTNITKMPEWYRTQIQNELVTRGGRR